MRPATQKKLDKVIKLIDKGHKPTNACKEVGVAYDVYKKYINERVEVSKPLLVTPLFNDNEEIEKIEEERKEAIESFEFRIIKLQSEIRKLKTFIKEFL